MLDGWTSSRAANLSAPDFSGHLSPQWTTWFLEGLTITLDATGDTLLTGPLCDQAALHGVFRKLRDVGLPLVSVNRMRVP